MEDYLETIALLKKNKGIVKVSDIGKMMKVKKPSVTEALNLLSNYNLVAHERYGHVELTSEGKKVAKEVQARHDVLTKFLGEVLKIDSRVAAEDACKMEHSLSPQTFKKLTKFIEFIEACPDGDRPDWLKSFDYYYKSGRRRPCKIRKLKRERN